MRTSTAYFAGLGTVVVAVVAGLGGGYLAANIVNPHEPGVSKLERRMSATPLPARSAIGTGAYRGNDCSCDEPDCSVSGCSASADRTAADSRIAGVCTAGFSTADTAKSEPQTTASNAAAPAEEKTANNAPRSVQPAPAKPAEQASEKPMVEKAAAPQEAFARARDADIKRAAVEKRRAERRQRWEERRRFRQPREQELEAVEEKVREVTEPRHAFAVERVRTESPRIRLFDLD